MIRCHCPLNLDWRLGRSFSLRRFVCFQWGMAFWLGVLSGCTTLVGKVGRGAFLLSCGFLGGNLFILVVFVFVLRAIYLSTGRITIYQMKMIFNKTPLTYCYIFFQSPFRYFLPFHPSSLFLHHHQLSHRTHSPAANLIITLSTLIANARYCLPFIPK